MDAVICLEQREIIIHPDIRRIPDRLVSFCGCNPSRPCGCLHIVMATSPGEGFTQDLTPHRSAAACGPDSPHQDGDEDLYALTDRNHRWWDGEDTPRPDITADPGPDRLERTLETCLDCGSVRATTILLPTTPTTPEIIIDAIVMDPRTETPAAWLHDSANDRMLPCTQEQHMFALRHTPEREQQYDWA